MLCDAIFLLFRPHDSIFPLSKGPPTFPLIVKKRHCNFPLITLIYDRSIYFILAMGASLCLPIANMNHLLQTIKDCLSINHIFLEQC